MPIDLSRYPVNWKAISAAIFERSGGRCECTGECGLHTDRCEARHGYHHPVTDSKVIQTTAHLGTQKPDGSPGDKHDKLDCRPENLKSMCQRCHLIFDLPDHIKHAAETRQRKALEAARAAGQKEMNL